MRVSAFWLLLSQFLPPVYGQVEEKRTTQGLSAPVEGYSLSANNFFEALEKAASDLKVPMGIEWIKGPNTLRGVNLSWRRAGVFDIIQSVCSAYADPEVQTQNGVVQVFPRGYFNDSRSVANLRIHAFEAHNEPLALASHRLHAMVHRMFWPAPPPRPGAGEAGSIVIGAGGDRIVNFQSQDATLREVLNGLALAAGEVNWVITYAADAKATDYRFRPTANPYSTDPVPEGQQPLWVFVPWGLKVSVR